MVKSLDLEAIRAEFPALRNCVFLQHGGQSPMPVRAVEAAVRAARIGAEGPPDANEEAYRAEVAGLKAALGRLLNVDPLDIALTRATAHGLSIVSSGLDWQPGDNVVTARYEFPTNLFPWQALEARGVEVRYAEPVEGRVTAQEIFGQVDARTRVVAVSFVQFWNGYRVDLAAIGAECRRRGVLLVVDGIQGVGAVRFDARAAGVDLLAAGGYKWLLGPLGIGFAYIRPELAERLRPPLVGSGTPDDPGTALEPRWTLGTRARRFEESAASWLDVAAFRAALTLFDEIGIEAIEQRVLHLSDYAGRALESAGFEVVAPWPRRPEESSGLIAFGSSRAAADAINTRLREANVFTRHLSGRWVRFSTHFHNTEAEIDRAVEIASTAI